MKQIFKAVTVLLLVYSAAELKAQTIEIDFMITSESINVSGQNVSLASTISKAENTLVWTLLTNENTDVNNFTITSVTGNWNQDTSIGSLSYSLIKDNQLATLILLGQQSGISATLTFKIDDDEEENYTFSINAFSYQ
jgi:hypothetical protein